MRFRKKFNFDVALLTLLSIIILCSAAPVKADMTVDTAFFDIGNVQTSTYDGSGWVTFNVDNQSFYDWGDFHVFIFEYPGPNNDITNVEFIDGAPYDPTSSQTPFTWDIGDDGKTIDYYYYGDPIYNNETGTFAVHIDNPDGTLHGVGYYPTMVPEPVRSTLFIVGGSVLGFRRFRKKFKDKI